MRYFICHTNRPNQDRNGQLLEDSMHQHHCAAMWENLPTQGQVHWLAHMARVQSGPQLGIGLIFMFANKGVGIIGVGRATGPREGPFLPGDARRIRAWHRLAGHTFTRWNTQAGIAAITSWPAPEWRVRVEWYCWDQNNPCRFRADNATFYEVDRKRVAAAIRHFSNCLPAEVR
jgi:hypothetical protein